eukprot:13706549-Ditylum_brightwellii.AAC.1
MASVDDHRNFEYSQVVYIPHLKNNHQSHFFKISYNKEGTKTICATEEHFFFISNSEDISFSKSSTVPAQGTEVGS